MLDASPDGLVLSDPRGVITFVNRQATTMFGYEAEDFVGMSVDQLLPEGMRSVHRAHRTRYGAAPTTRTMGSGLELLALRADGTTFHCEISLSPLSLRDEMFVVAAVRDVTERVAAEDHLRRVLEALDATEDAIVLFDAATLRFSHVNDGAVRMLGYGRDELAAMTPMHLNPDEDEADYRALVDELLAGPDVTVRRDARLLARHGAEIRVENVFRAAPADREGSQWIISVARDVTARLRAEEELEANRSALREAEHNVVLAEDRARIARDLHDTVIQRLFGAGLRLQSIAAVADERMRIRLDETIDDLDDTIRELRSTIFSLQTSERTLAGLRGRLLEVVSEAGAASGVEPRLQFDGAIDALDPRIGEELVPTLREALSNVARHAHAREVRVTVTAADDVTLRVTDDGVGIPGEVHGGRGIENMCDRARRLGGTATIAARDEGGTELVWTVPSEPSGAPGAP